MDAVRLSAVAGRRGRNDNRDLSRSEDTKRNQASAPADKLDQSILASIPKTELKRLSHWLSTLAEDWRGDIPLRLHERGSTTEGTLPFSGDFIRYVGYLECKVSGCTDKEHLKATGSKRDGYRNPESRLRATRAFRKVRKVAPREFDVLYLYCINGYSVPQVAAALNERAIRLGKPERYDAVSVFMLLISGTDKVVKYW